MQVLKKKPLRGKSMSARALGGRSQISVGDYPRMTYLLSVTTRRSVDLSVALPKELADVVVRCLRDPRYSKSQELAAIWIAEGIESVVLPSATGAGRNVVVYLANAGARSVAVRNRDDVLATLRRERQKVGGPS